MSSDSVHPLVTEDDQGPAITIASALCLSIMLLALCVRLWIRFPWASLFSHDDWVTATASAIATVQSILIMVAVRSGLGQRMGNETARSLDVLNMIYASSILYTLALCLGKLAVALLVFRLGASQRHKRIVGSLAACIVILGVGSILAVALPHDVTEQWGSRHSVIVHWIAVETIGLVFELLILASVISLVSGLEAGREMKAAVFAGFSIRMALFAIAPVRLYYISTSYSDESASLTFAATLPQVLTQLEMQCNIIGATVPCLRVFHRHFSSGYLGRIGLDAPDEYHSCSGTRYATKGSVTGKDDSMDTMQDQAITVRTSVELQSLETGRAMRWKCASRGVDAYDDRASDESINPLNPNTTKTDAYH